MPKRKRTRHSCSFCGKQKPVAEFVHPMPKMEFVRNCCVECFGPGHWLVIRDFRHRKTGAERTPRQKKQVIRNRLKKLGAPIIRKRGQWFRGASDRLTENATGAERRLKEILNAECVQFHFQRPILPYIVDFYIHAPSHGIHRTVVELDGRQHRLPKNRAKDDERTAGLLNRLDVDRVVRFENREIFTLTTYDILNRMRSSPGNSADCDLAATPPGIEA